MFKYTFSKREKVLVVFASIVLVALAWYFFVFTNTTNEVSRIEQQISDAESLLATTSGKVQKKKAMEDSIAKLEAQGAKPRPVPDFDNISALMSELNRILSQAVEYSLTFEDPDKKTSPEYILRPATITYSTMSFADATRIAEELTYARFPSKVDSISISDTSSTKSRGVGGSAKAPVTATVHITFYEHNPKTQPKTAENVEDSSSTTSNSK